MQRIAEKKDRWKLAHPNGICWDVQKDTRIPHTDSVEMSGRGVSLIVRYGIEDDGRLFLSRKIVWPALRIIPNNTYGSLIREYGPEFAPEIRINGGQPEKEKPSAIFFDGILTAKGRTGQGLEIVHSVFPSTEHAAAIERFTLKNSSDRQMKLSVKLPRANDTARGTGGIYLLGVSGDEAGLPTSLPPGKSASFDMFFSGRKLMAVAVPLRASEELEKRRSFLHRLSGSLRLETPEAELARAFDFAKIRAAESVFRTKSGLMHCPGGGTYYAAIWANDQAEYAGPFFPFLGDPGSIEASLNCYRLFRPFMGPDYQPIPSSIVAEGLDIWEGAGDRGDAAMYAYGASRFILALGDRGVAEELWPAVVWSLEYCMRKLTPDGVVASDTDELEGRFPSGKANLSTSCLAYGGLRSAACLACALGREKEAAAYTAGADRLGGAIEAYFGANVEGYDTYRYYDGNDILRSWICLPLAMGLMKRKQGTIAALFSPRLWTDDGLATQAGDSTYWDRATLYGLRSVFASGETEKGMSYLRKYTHRRLLGERVPYPIEAYPEGDKRHLSAESALYCRVITEGLFGINPTGLNSFTCAPHLPREWNEMALCSIKAFGRDFSIRVVRGGGEMIRVSVLLSDRPIYECSCVNGQEVPVRLPQPGCREAGCGPAAASRPEKAV